MKLDGWKVASVLAVVLVIGALVYRGSNMDEDAEGGVRARACTTLKGEPEARLDGCLAEMRSARLSSGVREVLESIEEGGALFVTGPALSVDGRQGLLADEPEIRTALMGIDEQAASRALRDGGYRGLVAYRDLTGALDRDARVLSRLAQHDHLEWFQLRYVTDDLMVYTVRNSSTRVPLATGTTLLAGLRARLEARPLIPRQQWKPDKIRMLGTLRLQGRTLVMRHAAGHDIETVLNELARKMKKRWDREVAVYGHGRLRDRLDEARLEIHLVMERAPVEPRGSHAIFDLWEPGVDGMFLRRDDDEDDHFTYMPGSEAVTRSLRGGDAFLRHAVDTFEWRDRRPWRDPKIELDIFRSQHFIEAEPGGGRVVRLYRGMPEVEMEDLTDDAIRDMLVAGGEWWLHNMRSDGSILYKYWPTQNRVSDDYNEVRHILATRDLADTWRYRPDDRYLEGSERAMEWLLKYQVNDTDPEHPSLPHPAEGSMLFRYPLHPTQHKVPNQKLGTVAVALLGWVAWAEATGDHREDDRIRRMARFVLSQRESSGKFNPYHVPFGHPYYQQKNDIVPGEAALALGEVADYFGEDHWLEFMPDFLDFYEPWWRSRAEKKNPYGRWPHSTYDNLIRLDLVQFGPWAVMATKQYYLLTGDERAARFGLEIADWMIENYQWREDRSPFPDYVGGYYKLPEELPAMQTFCYSEGTAAAYHIAAKLDPSIKDRYDTSTREAIRFLEVMQFDDVDSYFAAEPDVLRGGIKYAMNENKVRIDYVGHGLSTLSQYLDARDFDPAVELQLTPWEVLEAPAEAEPPAESTGTP